MINNTETGQHTDLTYYSKVGFETSKPTGMKAGELAPPLPGCHTQESRPHIVGVSREPAGWIQPGHAIHDPLCNMKEGEAPSSLLPPPSSLLPFLPVGDLTLGSGEQER